MDFFLEKIKVKILGLNFVKYLEISFNQKPALIGLGGSAVPKSW